MADQPYIVFGQPRFEEDEIEAVTRTLKSGWVGTGPQVGAFETAFADYIQAPYCVALSSCTAALHLALLACGVGPEDEVIVPALTFCATANAVIHCGATPVFVDVDPDTLVLSVDCIRQAVNGKTKAVIAVDLYGYPAPMQQLAEFCRKKGLFLVEDAAHAIETCHQGNPSGFFADIAAYSFYVTKNLTTVEGGMIATRSEKIASEVKVKALHGMSKDAWQRYSDSGYRHYDVVSIGFKYNMTDMQAALGLVQLQKLRERWQKRKQLWDYYTQKLHATPLLLPPQTLLPGDRHACHLFALRLPHGCSGADRDKLLQLLHLRGIGTGVHYRSLTSHSFYRKTYGVVPDDTPVATRAGDTTFSIPFSASLHEGEIQKILQELVFSLKQLGIG